MLFPDNFRCRRDRDCRRNEICCPPDCVVPQYPNPRKFHLSSLVFFLLTCRHLLENRKTELGEMLGALTLNKFCRLRRGPALALVTSVQYDCLNRIFIHQTRFWVDMRTVYLESRYVYKKTCSSFNLLHITITNLIPLESQIQYTLISNRELVCSDPFR